MSPAKRVFTFALSDELKQLLQAVRRRDGVSEAEQIRRGLRLWFESKGYTFDEEGRLKTEHRRGIDGAASEDAGPKKRRVTKKARA